MANTRRNLGLTAVLAGFLACGDGGGTAPRDAQVVADARGEKGMDGAPLGQDAPTVDGDALLTRDSAPQDSAPVIDGAPDAAAPDTAGRDAPLPDANSDQPDAGASDTATGPCRLVQAETRVTMADGDSVAPMLRSDGDSYLLTWSDKRTGILNVMASRFDLAGNAVVLDEVLVSATKAAGRPWLTRRPAGGHWLLWEDWENDAIVVRARSIDATLKIKGEPVIVGATGIGDARPGAVTTADGVFAVWMTSAGVAAPDAGTGLGPTKVQVARLGEDGAPVSNPAIVSLGGDAGRYPFIASAGVEAGSKLAVAFTEGAADARRVKVALLDASLSVTTIVTVRDEPTFAYNPTIAWDGARWVVAWEDGRSGEEQIYAARVSATGSAEPAVRIDQAIDESGNWPSAAVGGDAGTAVSYYGFINGAQIMIALLGADGMRVGPSLQVSMDTRGARFPSLAWNATSREFAVAWQDSRFSTAANGPEIFFARVRCGGP